MLRALLGLEHCVKNTVDTWLANSGYKISRYAGEPTYGKGLIVTNDGWLSTPLAGTVATRQLSVINFDQFMAKSGATQIHFGFRARLDALGYNLNDIIHWIDHGNGSTATPSLYWYHLFPSGSAVGREVHFMTTIDLTNSTFSTYINGVLAGTANITAANRAGMLAGAFSIVLGHSTASAAGVASFRDFWVTDDIQGDGMTGRLGDRRIYPVTADAVSGTGWSTSDGSDMLATLNASPEKASPAVINGSAGAGELAVSLNSNVPANLAIDAIQILAGMVGNSSTSQTLTRFRRGSGQTTPKTTPLTTTLQYGLPVGVITRTPDGQRLTNANINDTTVCFTPD